jgi:ubiquinol-cytochrome c reductase cytochrome c1 subunit
MFVSGRITSAIRKKTLVFGLSLGISSLLAYNFLRKDREAAFGYVEENLEYPHYHWYHNGLFHSFDHNAIRRGFLVYDTIAKPCHSMKGQFYRQLINVSHTEDEVRAIAAEQEGYNNSPNEEGEVTPRNGLPNDRFWAPYANEQEARFNNNGALPPDLTFMVRARHGNENYVFALLTGYRDPPHGVVLGENMYYNIYFPGGQISMPPPLAAGAVDYDDGTEASVSQMAKDVTTYLSWASQKDHDERKLMALKSYACVALLSGPFYWGKKNLWNNVKKRNVEFLRRARD